MATSTAPLDQFILRSGPLLLRDRKQEILNSEAYVVFRRLWKALSNKINTSIKVVFYQRDAGFNVAIDCAFKNFSVFFSNIAMLAIILKGEAMISVAMLVKQPSEFNQPRVPAVFHQTVVEASVSKMPLALLKLKSLLMK